VNVAGRDKDNGDRWILLAELVRARQLRHQDYFAAFSGGASQVPCDLLPFFEARAAVRAIEVYLMQNTYCRKRNQFHT